MKTRHVDDDQKRIRSSIPTEIEGDERKWIETRIHDEAVHLSSQMGMENFWKVMRFSYFVATTIPHPRLDRDARRDLFKKAKDARRTAKNMRRDSRFLHAVADVEKYAKERDSMARLFDPFPDFPYMAFFNRGRGDRIDARRAYFVATLTEALMGAFETPHYDWTAILFGATFGDGEKGITPRIIEGIYRRTFERAPGRRGGKKPLCMVDYGLELNAKD